MAAKTYHAVSQIQVGKGGGEITVFEAGDQVTELSKEQMVELWNAGVLEERDPDARPKDDRDERIKELEDEIKRLRETEEAEPEMKAAAERGPEQVPGLGSMFSANNPDAVRTLEGTAATEGTVPAGKSLEDKDAENEEGKSAEDKTE